MTIERYLRIENEMEKISTTERLTDEEIAEEQMFLFEDLNEFDEWNDIHNGNAKPITNQDRLEEIADEQYNRQKEES